MITKIRILAGTAVAAVLLSAAPAQAIGYPVIDGSAIMRMREQIATLTKQLSAIQQQTQQVTQMRNTIGQIGPGMLGKILKDSGIDFANPTGAFKDIGSMASQVDSVTSQASKLKIGKETGAAVGKITDLASGREAAAKLFFYNGDDAMNSDTINQLRSRRGVMVRESALSGYGAASSMKADLVATQKVAAGLSTQAKDSPDLRGDVQVNTSVMLAMYGEMAKQTALMAQGLEINSAQTLAQDSVGRRGN